MPDTWLETPTQFILTAPTQVIKALEKNKELSEDFLRPVWDLWEDDVSEAEYRETIKEPMDLKTLSKHLDKGGCVNKVSEVRE